VLPGVKTVTVFLDIDGTLLDHDAALRTGALGVLGAFRHVFPRAQAGAFAEEWHRLAEKDISCNMPGQRSVHDQRRHHVRELFSQAWVNLTDTEADSVFQVYLDYYAASWKPFPDVVRCLETLADYPLGIITNGDEEQERQKLEAMGVAQYFTHVITSGIFIEACRRAGCAPESAFYVGDRFEPDVLASRAAGLHGVWLDRRGSGSPAGDVPTLSGLGDLRAYVEQIRIKPSKTSLSRACSWARQDPARPTAVALAPAGAGAPTGVNRGGK
jgi:putative hydrolase of the HAD superfamily